MFDTIQILLWTLTYILIIISGFKSFKAGKVAMPYIAGALNLAWEISATIISRGFWGHICWTSLDIIIYIIATISLFKLNRKKCVLYLFGTALSTAIFLFILKMDGGMIISGFIIDFLMAVDYLVEYKSLSIVLIIPISITKMLGDLSALMEYAKYSTFVIVVGICVLLTNLFYFCICLEQIGRTRIGKKQKK